MAQLAIALAERGFKVSGSDKEFYDPMATLLLSSEVKCHTGYAASNIALDAALVVIGNSVSYDHPEVLETEKRGIPFTLFPKLIYEMLVQGKHSIVIAGTHGKTTTSAMIAHIFNSAGERPSYFIGGNVRGFERSLKQGSGNWSILEGDEYDSAFFAKVPKFSFYRPNTLIITSVEYDHADIYPDLASINLEFDKLVNSLGSSDRVICCEEGSNLKELIKKWGGAAKCRLLTYGDSKLCNFYINSTRQEGARQFVSAKSKEHGDFEFEVGVPGLHNARNALAAIIASLENGLAKPTVLASLATFKGVMRRQEVKFEGRITLVEDFAHHPTAVKETIDAMKRQFPNRKIWAVFEPRSNTSRRKVFQESYIEAFAAADQVILCEVVKRSIDSDNQLLEVSTLTRAIQDKGVAAATLPNAEAISKHLLAQVHDGDVVLVMSNGSFGGLIERLVEGLKGRFAG